MSGGPAEEQQSGEVLGDRTRSWWASVLAGQIEGGHPIHGTALQTKLEGDTLVVSGVVATERDRSDLDDEVQRLVGHGVAAVQNEVTVNQDVAEQPGLLIQRLMATYPNADAAQVAERTVHEHVHIHPHSLEVITPDDIEQATAAMQRALTEPYWEDGTDALEAGRSLIIMVVDEVEAFKAREVLDEETRSLETIVLPPEAAAQGTPGRSGTTQTPGASERTRIEPSGLAPAIRSAGAQ